MTASRASAQTTAARIRVPSYAVWEVAVFVLNVLAFILVGLQLRQIVERAAWTGYAGAAAAVCLAVILARILWVSGAAGVGRWRCRTRGASEEADLVALSGRAAAVVGWCGMRGIVTLAAALALPIDFPYRDFIFFTSFAVVHGTLVVQGMPLRPLLAWLRLGDDGTVDREVRLARIESLRAALVASRSGGTEGLDLLRRRYEIRLRRAERAGPDQYDPGDAEAVRLMTAAERRRLIELREDGTIGDAAFQHVEQELDLRELALLEPQASPRS